MAGGGGAVELGAEVGGDGVDDDEADGVAADGGGELEAEDVVLGFEGGGVEGEDAGEGGRGGGGRGGGAEEGVGGEDLGEALG